MGDFTAWQWLVLVERELLLFAGLFFLIGAIDEFAVDLVWLWLRVTGRASTPVLAPADPGEERLRGTAAVFIPAWREAQVIGATVRHALAVWRQPELRIYVGCYANDAATLEAASRAAAGDPRLRIVVHDRPGPTTKADCLNRLYRALERDEALDGVPARMVVLHDAEDMVHPRALPLLDAAIGDAALVQLPVRPEPQATSPWVAGHYCDEFAEAHAKTMVVREALGSGVPSAGVGCAVARDVLARLAQGREAAGPFQADCLTEDYELGLGLAAMGLPTRFVRARDTDGALIATRACFPATLGEAVRQKTRWVHGIALQGWDRMGWRLRPADLWMLLRDRKGPLTALVLSAGYLLLGVAALLAWAREAGLVDPVPLGPVGYTFIALNLFSFVWRAGLRFAFVAREYGAWQGVRAVLRIPIGNVIAIMAARRAMKAYLGTLSGGAIEWDKTSHYAHPTHNPVARATPRVAT